MPVQYEEAFECCSWHRGRGQAEVDSCVAVVGHPRSATAILGCVSAFGSIQQVPFFTAFRHWIENRADDKDGGLMRMARSDEYRDDRTV
jgi:hypothetical protein